MKIFQFTTTDGNQIGQNHPVMPLWNAVKGLVGRYISGLDLESLPIGGFQTRETSMIDDSFSLHLYRYHVERIT